MNLDQKAAFEKIKKLLRMKRGGTAVEIATALRLAQKLADKHGIDLSSVNPEQEDERPITDHFNPTGARIQWECKYSMLICKDYFHVSTFIQRGGIRFVGTEWDLQIASYIYTFLVRCFRREWRNRRGRLRNRQAFMYGMFIGICSKLSEGRAKQAPGSPGIVLLERGLARRQDYMNQRWTFGKGGSVIPVKDSDRAQYVGFVAGRETEIRPAVSGATQSVALLPA